MEKDEISCFVFVLGRSATSSERTAKEDSLGSPV